MSGIDELVSELCPDGVEYKRLSEMGKFVRGKRFVWKDVVPDGKPCIHYSELYTTYGLATKKTVSHLDEGKYEKLRFANPGDVVIVGAGETVEDIGIGVAWLGTEPAAVHDACYIYKHGDTLDPVFISYYLRSGFYHNQITRFVSSAKISSISADNLGRALIPVPPIEVQREVVRILDAFTALTDELTAKLAEEVAARKAQYAYYRDRLLSRESLEALDGKPVEMVRLGDVFDLKNGYTPSKKKAEYWENGEVNWFRMEDIRANGNVLNDSIQKVSIDGIKGGKLFEANSLIVATSATIGEHALVTVPFMCNQRFTCLTRKPAYRNSLDMKFVSHYASKLDEYCLENTNQGGFASVSMPAFKSFPIPVPSLATQQKVVDILDRFDALTTSLTDGLPAEIEARKAQYAYYRDRLLDFPRKEVAAS